MSVRRSVLVAVLALALAGCGSGGGVGVDGGGGGSGGSPAASGLDSNALVRNLTDAQVRSLCDWVAMTGGGYGHVTTCDGGLTVRAKANQQACADSLKQTASCTATVRDVETCSLHAAQAPCNLSVFVSAQCSALLTCD